MTTPKEDGFHQPAEWAPHKSVWLAWPYDKSIWLEHLEDAQNEFIEFCKAISDEAIEMLVLNEEMKAKVEKHFSHLNINFHFIAYGDIWLRDIAPIFLKNKNEVASVRFKFNGWGEKYIFEHDNQVAEHISNSQSFKQYSFPWVLEGGSVDVDGAGTALTSRQCLLNPNRNPNLSMTHMENEIKKAYGVEKVLWLNEGLINDHTDGHIDTMARFVAPGKVLCMKPQDGDPNAPILNTIIEDLRNMTDAHGNPLEIGLIPSPGAITDSHNDLLPASYLNFYISNKRVIVPTYGSPHDQEAVTKISEFFPNRETIGLSAKAILTGGGAFHCISQQQPL